MGTTRKNQEETNEGAHTRNQDEEDDGRGEPDIEGLNYESPGKLNDTWADV